MRISNARYSAASAGLAGGRGCTELAPAKAMAKRTAARIEPTMAAVILRAKAGRCSGNIALSIPDDIPGSVRNRLND
jgi:hypothetical protein